MCCSMCFTYLQICIYICVHVCMCLQYFTFLYNLHVCLCFNVFHVYMCSHGRDVFYMYLSHITHMSYYQKIKLAMYRVVSLYVSICLLAFISFQGVFCTSFVS